MGRGSGLEFILGRAIRAGIRVVLLSSQLPMGDDLVAWMGGQTLESDWAPTWLRRFVYFCSPGKEAGLLQREGGDAQQVLTLTGSKKPNVGECARSRAQEAAALAGQHDAVGLVVVYSDQRARIEGLAAAADEWFSGLPPLDNPTQCAGRGQPRSRRRPSHSERPRPGYAPAGGPQRRRGGGRPLSGRRPPEGGRSRGVPAATSTTSARARGCGVPVYRGLVDPPALRNRGNTRGRRDQFR
jgi:hypothetical protein